MHREYVYPAFERFWHWAQAILILFLALTGFEIHGSLSFFGFRNAVAYHNVAAKLFLILIAFAIFWHITTGQWKQYVPTLKNFRAQVDYYITGIFRNAPHPTHKSALSKLNPIQRLVYAGLKLLVIPCMVTSGLLYMFYRYPQSDEVMRLNIGGLSWVAIIHTAGAFALVTFLIAHIYLISTGRTVSSNLKAMITGFEEVEPEERELLGAGSK